MTQADKLPPGAAKLAVYDEAIRLADFHNDVDLGFRARTEMMEAALDSGGDKQLLTAFTWCLAKHDEQPERFPHFDVHFAFRWVISEVSSHPQFSRAQIEALVDDMARRYTAAGLSQRPVHYLRMNILDLLGDRSLARETMRKARRLPRDWMCDSPVAELSFEIGNLILQRREADALKKAQPFLSGKIRDGFHCFKVFAKMLMPLLKRKRTAEAMECCRQSLRGSGGNPRFISRYGWFIGFLALTGNTKPALELLRKHLRHAFEWVDLNSRFEFCLGCGHLLERLTAAGDKPVKLTLPEELGDLGPSRSVKPSVMAARLRDEAAAIADQFDTRNGNSSFRETIAEQAKLRKLAIDFPMDPAKRDG